MSAEPSEVAIVPSPCVSLCVIDPPTGLCAGCYRTLHEIAAWIDLSADERSALLAVLRERQARHGEAIARRMTDGNR